MEVWIIVDGEKKGPLPDFEVRGMIARGELNRDAKCWQQGMSEWKPISAMPLFEREFSEPQELEQPTESSMHSPPPPARPSQTYWMRRFWARWFDLTVYASFWWGMLHVLDADIEGVIGNVFLMIFLYLPWVPLESLLLTFFGKTPGKWLLGLRVVNDNGGRLNGNQSVARALRVYVLGIGLGASFVSPLCQLFSWFQLRSIGKTVWDARGGHRVEGHQLPVWGVFAYLFAGFIAVVMQTMVLSPYVLEPEQIRIFKEKRDEAPPFMQRFIDRMPDPDQSENQ